MRFQFLVTRALGVTSALELDGATIAYSDDAERQAVESYFAANGLVFEPVDAGSEPRELRRLGSIDAIVVPEGESPISGDNVLLLPEVFAAQALREPDAVEPTGPTEPPEPAVSAEQGSAGTAFRLVVAANLGISSVSDLVDGLKVATSSADERAALDGLLARLGVDDLSVSIAAAEEAVALQVGVIDAYLAPADVSTRDVPDGSTILPEVIDAVGAFRGEPEVPAPEPAIGEGLTVEEARAVALLYEAGLNRDGNIDHDGLNFWIDVREGADGRPASATQTQVAQAFLDSREFELSFGDPDELGDRDYVRTLYRNVLDREGEAAGVDFWTGVVARPDVSRAQVLERFAVSIENAETLEFVETLTEVSPGEWDFVA